MDYAVRLRARGSRLSFTGNRPGARRAGSVGRPLAGRQIPSPSPDESGIGEIQLRGSSITHGYIDNPEANQAAFTGDGWFHTGDLGFLDDSGFLFVTGRAKEILVLGGGKKVSPEELERIYGTAPEIVELAVLEDKGDLVALVRPTRQDCTHAARQTCVTASASYSGRRHKGCPPMSGSPASR